MVEEAKDVEVAAVHERATTIFGTELREGERPLDQDAIKDLKLLGQAVETLLEEAGDGGVNVHEVGTEGALVKALDEAIRQRIDKEVDVMTLSDRRDKLLMEHNRRIREMMHNGAGKIAGQLRGLEEKEEFILEQNVLTSLLPANRVVQAAVLADNIGFLCQDTEGTLSIPQAMFEESGYVVDAILRTRQAKVARLDLTPPPKAAMP